MDLAALRTLAAQQADALDASRRFAERVRTELGPRVAWIRLFGSLARGDWMGPDDSDVDIAVALHDRTDADVNRIIHLCTESLLAHGFVISPQILTPDEFTDLEQRELRLARDIRTEGVAL